MCRARTIIPAWRSIIRDEGGGERGRRYYKFYSVLGRVVQLLSDGEEVSYTERKNVGVCLDSSSYVHVVDSCARRAAFKFQIVRRIHLSGGCAWSVYDKVALSQRTRRAVRSASPRLAVQNKEQSLWERRKFEGRFLTGEDRSRSIVAFPPPISNLSRESSGGSWWSVGGRDAPSRASENLSRDRLIFLQSIATIHSPR